MHCKVEKIGVDPMSFSPDNPNLDMEMPPVASLILQFVSNIVFIIA